MTDEPTGQTPAPSAPTDGGAETERPKQGGGGANSPPQTAPQPVSNTVTIAVNGTRHEVSPGGSFPEDDPIFRLVSLKRGTAKVGIVGGGYANGAPTIRVDEGRKAGHADEHRGRHDLCPAVRRIKASAAAADRALVRKRLRADQCFGMIELLMAMVILNIGILAIVASFNAGIFTLNRASRITTTVPRRPADGAFRAIEYESIRPPRRRSPSLRRTRPTRVQRDADHGSELRRPLVPERAPRRARRPGRRKPYRINTYIVETTPVNGRRSSR